MRNTMIKKLLLNQGKYETVEGVPPLTLEKSLGRNLKDYKLYGNSFQDGTPTPDTPVEVQSVGERTINKFEGVQNINASGVTRDNYKNGIRATTKTDGGYSNYVAMDLLKQGEFEWGKTYTISCFAEQTNVDMGSLMRVGYFRTTQNTWRSIKDITIKNNKTNTLTFTLPSEVPEDFGENEYYSNNNIQMLFNVQVTKLGALGTLTVTDIMVVDGDTATPYEPYGKYKVPVVTQGKNIINIPNGSDNLNPATYDITNICPRDVTITLSAILTRTIPVGGEDKRVRINYVVDGTTKYFFGYGTERSAATGIIPSNATNVSITFQKLYNSNGYIGWQNAQLEIGAIATDFEPYQQPTITNIYLTEPLRKVGEYSDCIDFANGKVVKRVLERTFNGEEDWILNSYSLTLGYKLYRLSVGENVVTNMGKCNIAEILPWDNILQDNCFAITSNLYLIRTNNSDDIEVWKAYLKEMYTNNMPVKCYTVLANPNETPIDLPQLPTLKGTTILDVDTAIKLSNMSATYKRR